MCAHSGAGRWILLAVCGPGCVWTCLSVALAACGPGGGSRAWPACVVCGGVGCGVRRSIPLLYAPLPPVPVIGMPKKKNQLAALFARQTAAETVRVSLCHCHAYRFLTNQMVGGTGRQQRENRAIVCAAKGYRTGTWFTLSLSCVSISNKENG